MIALLVIFVVGMLVTTGGAVALLSAKSFNERARLHRADRLLQSTIADRDRIKHELQQALLALEDAKGRRP